MILYKWVIKLLYSYNGMLVNGKVLSRKQNILFRENHYGGLETNELLTMVPAFNKRTK